MSRTPFSKLATCLLVALFSHLHRPALGILDPLSDKEYSIVITDAPLQLQTSGGQVVDIADARGRTLHCLIPQGEGEAGSKRSRIQNTSAWALLDPLGALPAAWALPATKGLDQVCQVDLAGQADRGKRCAEDQCFGKRDGMGWWTVSVCYKKQAEQYHEVDTFLSGRMRLHRLFACQHSPCTCQSCSVWKSPHRLPSLVPHARSDQYTRDRVSSS